MDISEQKDDVADKHDNVKVFTKPWLQFFGLMKRKTKKNNYPLSALYNCYSLLVFFWLTLFTVRLLITMFIDEIRILLFLGDIFVYFPEERKNYYKILLLVVSCATVLITFYFQRDYTQRSLLPWQKIDENSIEIDCKVSNMKKNLQQIAALSMILLPTGLLSFIHTKAVQQSDIQLINFTTAVVLIVIHGMTYFFIFGIYISTLLHFNLICHVLGKYYTKISVNFASLCRTSILPNMRSAFDKRMAHNFRHHMALSRLLYESNNFWNNIIGWSFFSFNISICYIIYSLTYGLYTINLVIFYTIFGGFSLVYLIILLRAASSLREKIDAPFNLLRRYSQDIAYYNYNYHIFVTTLRLSKGYMIFRITEISFQVILMLIHLTTMYYLISADASRSMN